MTLRCDKGVKGWRCRRAPGHDGPCATEPCWWNLADRWKFRGLR